MLLNFCRGLILCSLLPTFLAASSPSNGRSWEEPEITLETGVLWGVGNSTPLSYRLFPTQLSWRSAEAFGWEMKDGTRVVVRHRFTLIGTWVDLGPESRYIGFSASPSIEWWNASGNWSLFLGAGGGAGFIDSRDVPGGQGQDFTLNWFARSGIEHFVRDDFRLSAGVMFQHLSNGGQTSPNPGVDAVGFCVGASWSY